MGIMELTLSIVNKFIEKIIVYGPDASIGHRVRKTQIVFNFIREFASQEEFVPDKTQIPQDYFYSYGTSPFYFPLPIRCVFYFIPIVSKPQHNQNPSTGVKPSAHARRHIKSSSKTALRLSLDADAQTLLF